jgi:hypothetical protein
VWKDVLFIVTLKRTINRNIGRRCSKPKKRVKCK